jgi:hypothetical protein
MRVSCHHNRSITIVAILNFACFTKAVNFKLQTVTDDLIIESAMATSITGSDAATPLEAQTNIMTGATPKDALPDTANELVVDPEDMTILSNGESPIVE